MNLGKGLARLYEIKYTLGAVRLVRIAEQFSCPISHEAAQEPVMTIDGQMYDKQNIKHWFSTRSPPTSPCTGSRLLSTALLPLHPLQQFVHAYINGRPEVVDSSKEQSYLLERIQAMAHTNDELQSDLEQLTVALSARDAKVRELEMRMEELANEVSARDAMVRGLEMRIEEQDSANLKALEMCYVLMDSRKVVTIQASIRGFLCRKNLCLELRALNAFEAMRKMDEKESNEKHKTQKKRRRPISAKEKIERECLRKNRRHCSKCNKDQTTMGNPITQKVMEKFTFSDAGLSDVEGCLGRMCSTTQTGAGYSQLNEACISPTPTKFLCVTHLPEDIQEEDLLDVFGQFGCLEQVFLWLPGAGFSTDLPYAYVIYLHIGDAEKAKARSEAPGIGINHSIIHVSFANLIQ